MLCTVLTSSGTSQSVQEMVSSSPSSSRNIWARVRQEPTSPSIASICRGYGTIHSFIPKPHGAWANVTHKTLEACFIKMSKVKKEGFAAILATAWLSSIFLIFFFYLYFFSRALKRFNCRLIILSYSISTLVNTFLWCKDSCRTFPDDAETYVYIIFYIQNTVLYTFLDNAKYLQTFFNLMSEKHHKVQKVSNELKISYTT